MQEKKAMRSHIRSLRKNLSPSYRQDAEKMVSQHLQELLSNPQQKIGIYLAFGSELDLSAYIQAALNNKQHLFAPFITEGSRLLHFTPYPSEKAANLEHYGIEQYEGTKHTIADLDVLLMPLIGIDAQGYRLGQGGGFYDTTLASCPTGKRPTLIGVGFDCQRIKQVPTEIHDMPIQTFVSESGCLSF